MSFRRARSARRPAGASPPKPLTTAAYDRMIATYLGAGEALRYGENPHQEAQLRETQIAHAVASSSMGRRSATTT